MKQNFFTGALKKAQDWIRKANENKPSKHELALIEKRRTEITRELNVRRSNFFYYNPFLNRQQRNQIAGQLRNGKLSKEHRKLFGDMLRNEPRNIPYVRNDIPRVHAGLASPAHLIVGVTG